MEEKQRKFVCKYCFKRYPCGKSLGGHIRTHMSEQRTHNAAAAAVAAAVADARVFKVDHAVRNKRDSSCSEGVGADGNNSYGLRENPRKTMRFVHSNHHRDRRHDAAAAAADMEHEMIKFCKECGKGFPSSKALCGHMASHSEKEKKINRFDQVMEDSQSDDDDTDDACAVAETMNLRKSKRRIRFKSLTLSNQNQNQIQNQPSSCSVDGSSSMSEMEQEQQQEVAMCLMLLSRDFFSHKGRFVSESSDNNNSVVLETKSYISDKKIVIRNCNKFVSSNDDHHEAAEKKLKSVGIGVSNKSDSRDFRYASKIKIIDSKASNFEFKRPKVEEDKSGFVDCKSKYNVTTTGFKKPGMMNKDLDHDSRKKSNYEGFGFNNGNKNEEINEDVRSGLKYEFYGSEKDDDSSYVSTTDEESDEEISSESDSFLAAKSHNSKKKSSNKAKKKLKSKKSKEYECPICYKIFRSGQALGGHKRSHFVGGSEENTTFVIKQNAAAPCLIDLNLPAPVDE